MPALDLWPLLSTLVIKPKNARLKHLARDDTFAWAQRQLVAEIERQYNAGLPVRIILCKGRQLGCSTITAAVMFLWAFLHEGSNGIVLSRENQESEYLFNMIRLFWEKGPLHDLFRTRYYTQSYVEWDGINSTILAETVKKADVGRGRTIHTAHCSETAFWDRADDMVPSLMNAVPYEHGTLVILESTPNGVGNYFHETWQDATFRTNEFVPMFFPWFLHDEYQIPGSTLQFGDLDDDEKSLLARYPEMNLPKLAWRRRKIAELPQREAQFMREYPCVIGSTRVGTERGIVEIATLPEFVMSTHGLVMRKFDNPVAPVYTLTTEDGYKVTGTANHPVFLGQPRGLLSGPTLPLADCLGETVALSSPLTAKWNHIEQWTRHGVIHRLEITEAWGEFLGFYMGDGSTHRDTFSIVCDSKDQDVVERVQKLFRLCVDLDGYTRQVGSKKGGTEVRVASKEVADLFDQLGLVRRNGGGTRKRHVHVPEMIWRSPLPVIRAFLRGLFEADGFNSFATPRIIVFSRYKEFLEDVQVLLLAFGIVSRITSRTKKAGDGSYHYIGNELTMSGQRAEAFMEKIGFVGERKNHPPSDRKKRGRPRGLNVLASKVVSIEPAGEAPVWNLSILDYQRYDANGILTHNCNPQEGFLHTGRNVFPLEKVEEIYKPDVGQVRGMLYNADGKIDFAETRGGHLTVYQWPDAARRQQYVVAVDPTWTLEGDPCCIQVLNRASLEQCAVWHGHADPKTIGEISMGIALYYHRALLNTEVQGGGKVVMEVWRNENYPNIWVDRRPDAIRKYKAVLGIYMSHEVKATVLGTMIGAFQRRQTVIHHPATYHQICNYISLGTGAFGPARRSGEDDCVMSFGIGLYTALTEMGNLDFLAAYGAQRGAPVIEGARAPGRPHIADYGQAVDPLARVRVATNPILSDLDEFY